MHILTRHGFGKGCQCCSGLALFLFHASRLSSLNFEINPILAKQALTIQTPADDSQEVVRDARFLHELLSVPQFNPTDSNFRAVAAGKDDL